MASQSASSSAAGRGGCRARESPALQGRGAPACGLNNGLVGFNRGAALIPIRDGLRLGLTPPSGGAVKLAH